MFSVEEGTYCLFEWHPRDNLTLKFSVTDNPEFVFLPQDFFDFMKSQPSTKQEPSISDKGHSETHRGLKRPHEDHGMGRESRRNERQGWNSDRILDY